MVLAVVLAEGLEGLEGPEGLVSAVCALAEWSPDAAFHRYGTNLGASAALA